LRVAFVPAIAPVTQDPEVILELPRRLFEDWNWENPSDLNSDEGIFSPAEAGV
jgi:hypothetical protein